MVRGSRVWTPTLCWGNSVLTRTKGAQILCAILVCEGVIPGSEKRFYLYLHRTGGGQDKIDFIDGLV